jgi:hypothetical protein
MPAPVPDTKKGKCDSMKKSTRFFALCLAMVMCTTLAMTGALGETPTETPTSAEITAAPVPSATPGSPDDVLATVNGKSLLRSDMQQAYDSIASQYTSYGYDLTGMESYIQSIALQSAIQYEVYKQKVAENGFDQFTPEEEESYKQQAQTEWDDYVNQYADSLITSETPTDEEKATAKQQAEDYMTQQGYKLDDLVGYYKDQAAQDKLVAFLTKDAQPFTDEEIQAAYQEKVDADKETFAQDVSQYEYATMYSGETPWYIPEGMRGITHILLTVDSALLEKYTSIQAQLEEQNAAAEEGQDEEVTEATATPDPAATPTVTPEPTATPVPVTQADLDAAKAAILDSVKTKTDDIYARLQNGEAFSALIDQYGEDPGMKEEPAKSEGYSVHLDSIAFDPAFVAGAFSDEMQKVGDVSQPVVGSYGVHILYYLRDVPGGAVSLTDELKSSLVEELESTRKSDALSNAVDEWVGAAQITYTNPQDDPANAANAAGQ